MVALQASEMKLPVLDILKNYEQPGNPGYVDHNTFAVNVMENDFSLKDRLTRNMLNVLTKRYDMGSDTMLNYFTFFSDLEVQQNMNPTTIRIFKTQNEINFF